MKKRLLSTVTPPKPNWKDIIKKREEDSERRAAIAYIHAATSGIPYKHKAPGNDK